jgi:ferric-dicitrate binding protein FerR (iron transport regulator)
VAGFYLATLVTAVAAIETQLRAEYGTGIKRFHELIDGSDLSENLKSEIHLLRRYRNRWVHVSDPWDDNRINTRWTCFNKVHQSW